MARVVDQGGRACAEITNATLLEKDEVASLIDWLDRVVLDGPGVVWKAPDPVLPVSDPVSDPR